MVGEEGMRRGSEREREREKDEEDGEGGKGCFRSFVFFPFALKRL